MDSEQSSASDALLSFHWLSAISRTPVRLCVSDHDTVVSSVQCPLISMRVGEGGQAWTI